MRPDSRAPGHSLLVGLVLATVVGLLWPAGQASAAGERAKATGIATAAGSAATANCPPGTAGSNPGGTFDNVGVGALATSCTGTEAMASVAGVALVGLQIGAVQSRCVVGGAASSSVVVVSGGGPTTGLVAGPVTIGVGVTTVKLNEVARSGGFVTVNALHITVPGGADIVVAQSRCMATAASPGRPASGAPVWLVVVAALVCLVGARVVVGDVLGWRRSTV